MMEGRPGTYLTHSSKFFSKRSIAMYTEIKPVIPTYLVQTTKDSFCYVEAGRCTVDTEHGIILFCKNDSVQAMFRLDDVKALWRVV